MAGERSDIDRFVADLLGRLLKSHRVGQVFLFGSEGDPFWAARSPVTASEVELLGDAIDLIVRLESDRPKPFVGHDPGRRFSVAGIGGAPDLYVALLEPGPDFEVAESRLVRLRDDVAQGLSSVRHMLVG